jgi:HK97 family phage portal protein
MWNPFRSWGESLARDGYTRMAAILGYGADSSSGENVDLQSMLTLSAVWGCSKVLSESFASLPCHLMEETKSGKAKQIDDPLYGILHDQWNRYTSSTSGRQCMMLWASNAGNSVARIEWANGKVKALWPMAPGEVEYERIPRGIKYWEPQPNGTKTEIPLAEVFHIGNLSGDGYLGLGIVDYAKNTIGNGLSAQKYAGKFFASGARVPGIIKVARPFATVPEADKFRADWEAKYSGPENVGKNIILTGDVNFTPLGISPRDAQFVEWSGLGVPDICRFYRMPPHMVADLSRATFSNIEHQGIEFVIHTLMPWIVRWEQQIQMRMISPDLAGGIDRVWRGARRYAKFSVDALMRGDFASRWAGYSTALQNGVYCIDDVLDLEDRNPLPNGAGQAHHIQLNMQTVPGTGVPTTSEAATLAKVDTAPAA